MRNQIIVTYIGGNQTVYTDGTIEFNAMLSLFQALTHKDEPKIGDAQSEERVDILSTVDEHNILEIEFSGFRRFRFEKVTTEEGEGYDVEYSSCKVPLNDILDAIKGNTKIEILGGTIEDLEKMGDKLPAPLREFLAEIKKRCERDIEEKQKDPRQTHRSNETAH